MFKLTKINGILIGTPLIASDKTPAPKPTALSRGFYWNLNSTFSEWTDYMSETWFQIHDSTLGRKYTHTLLVSLQSNFDRIINLILLRLVSLPITRGEELRLPYSVWDQSLVNYTKNVAQRLVGEAKWPQPHSTPLRVAKWVKWPATKGFSTQFELRKS